MQKVTRLQVLIIQGIIIKMVNVTGYPKTFAVDIAGAENIADTAQVSVAAGNRRSF